MIRRILVPLLVCGAFFLAGCASRHQIELSDLLRDIDLEPDATSKEFVGGDLPDSPVSSLPPPPAGLVEGQGEVARGITIQPDSLLQISVDEDPSLDGSYPVNEIGAVQLGYVGPVILLNKTESQAAEKIVNILKYRDFRKATVNVRIIRASYDKVRVAGAVGNPGFIKIGAGDSILLNDAILRAGELKTSIRGARVKIVRGGVLSAIAPAMPGEEYALTNDAGDPMVPDVRLRNNDVVYVFATIAGPDRESEGGGVSHVLVLGEVGRKGYYNFAQGEPCTMMHLLFKMGGLPRFANEKKIKVIRTEEDGREEVFYVNADGIMEEGDPDRDFPLQDGDRVIVSARRVSLF